MPNLGSNASSRFAARVSPERKSLWKQAAKIRGNTLTDFVVKSADAAAELALKESQFEELTRRDRIAFVEALLKPAAHPNKKLREAAKRYAQMFPTS